MDEAHEWSTLVESAVTNPDEKNRLRIELMGMQKVIAEIGLEYNSVSSIPSPAMHRLKQVMEKIEHANSVIGNSISKLENLPVSIVKILRHYNKIAIWCGLPAIPIIGPELQTNDRISELLISHAWDDGEHYRQVIAWIEAEPDFKWKNHSTPNPNSCPKKTKAGLKICLTNQIKPAQMVILLSGMSAANHEWIDYEVDEALRMGKTIIGVKPWGSEKIPLKIREVAVEMVGWNRQSIIQAIKKWG